MASPEIAQTSGLFATYCAMHGTSVTLRNRIPIHIRREPVHARRLAARRSRWVRTERWARMPRSHSSRPSFSTPVTDPTFGAWFDRLGLEPADKCVWTFGTTYTAPNGARANVRLGSRDYLLQQLWVPSKTGGACGLHP